ncbi:ankyrin repeat-containing domain protein [Xylaria cubensis]|nr:ankyrin repeat-containing domain protein [Xylaria cubensis]
MFLYVKVVMDNLMAQGSATELEQELGVNFPSGLDEAYERIVFRVLDSPARHKSQREAAAQILRWLTCAIRPLRWNEIQSLFCIDPRKGECNPRNRRVDNCKSICGSFVEVDEHESTIPIASPQVSPVVNLVHDTARRYLIQARRVNLLEDNASMAILSSAYLASLPLSHASQETDIYNVALTGYYGIQDYMISSWQNHLLVSLKPGTELSPETTKELKVLVRALLQPLNLNVISEDSVDDWGDSWVRLDGIDFSHCSQRLERISSTIRVVTERIHLSKLDARTRDVFLSLNGIPQYKCPRLDCLMFSHGFQNQKARDRHVAQHYSQFHCPVDGCPRQGIGFTSHLDLKKHTKDAHTNLIKQQDLFPRLQKSTDIWSACENGDVDFVRDFFDKKRGDLQAGREHNSWVTPIIIAARHGHLDLCQYLVHRGCSSLQAKAKSSKCDNTALGAAINLRNKELFAFFLDSATETETQEFIDGPFFERHIGAAFNSGERSFLDTLLELLPKRRSPLRYKNIIYWAIDFAPSRPNHRDLSSLYESIFSMLPADERSMILTQPITEQDGNCLHMACANNNQSAASFLIQHMEARDVYAQDNKERTPVFTAISHGALECVKVFLDYDAARTLNTDYITLRPLHFACFKGQVEIAKLLLPYSINNLNEQNVHGKTPLHICIDSLRDIYRKSAIVRALLETGSIDLSIRNKRGETVFDLEPPEEILSLLYAANGQGPVQKRPFLEPAHRNLPNMANLPNCPHRIW